MRILGIGQGCELGALYHRLQREGHEVRVFVEDCSTHGIFDGLLHRTDDWRGELPWLRAGRSSAVALFECASHGAWQDELRADGFHVVGGSGWGDRVEADRAFGQQEMRRRGMSTAATHAFTSYDAALQFLAQHPARYVLKLNGAEALRTRSFVGELDDGRDMAAVLLRERALDQGGSPNFVLMEHVEGIEVGVGAFFNGENFLQPAVLDWEHKHFFPGELGELTGEMGTVVTYDGSTTLFERVLAPFRDALRDARHCGYVNINLMINAKGIWPLEFTSRFGYPGYAICSALHRERWDVLLQRIVSRDSLTFDTFSGFACGVVLCVPPFPYSDGEVARSGGLPIVHRRPKPYGPLRDHDDIHFCEVRWSEDQLLTSGPTGYVGVATGRGASVEASRRAAYAAASDVVVPNLRYRNDIGQRVPADLRQLATWGYVPQALMDAAVDPPSAAGATAPNQVLRSAATN